MNWKYFVFNIKATKYFKQQQEKRDQEFLKLLSKNLYKKEIKIEQAEKVQKNILLYLQQKIE